MTHLGDRITPLVDNQLSADSAERARIHLARCASCRQATDAEYLIKARLAALGTPQPGNDLMERLLGLAAPGGPVPPRPGHVPGSPRPRPVTVPGRPPRAMRTPTGTAGQVAALAGPGRGGSTVLRRAGRRDLSRPARLRLGFALVGALALVGAGVAGTVSAAGTGGSPSVKPAVDSFVVEHGASSGSLLYGNQTVSWGSAGDGR